LAVELQEGLGVESEIVAGGGGIFDVVVDGELVFSKDVTGRFPEDGEVLEHLQGRG